MANSWKLHHFDHVIKLHYSRDDKGLGVAREKTSLKTSLTTMKQQREMLLTSCYDFKKMEFSTD